MKASLIILAAPISTPHVGWDTIKTLGSLIISLPTTNFWRFPPERDEAKGFCSGTLTSKS